MSARRHLKFYLKVLRTMGAKLRKIVKGAEQGEEAGIKASATWKRKESRRILEARGGIEPPKVGVSLPFACSE
jgi:hypothetical protein